MAVDNIDRLLFVGLCLLDAVKILKLETVEYFRRFLMRIGSAVQSTASLVETYKFLHVDR